MTVSRDINKKVLQSFHDDTLRRAISFATPRQVFQALTAFDPDDLADFVELVFTSDDRYMRSLVDEYVFNIVGTGQKLDTPAKD